MRLIRTIKNKFDRTKAKTTCLCIGMYVGLVHANSAYAKTEWAEPVSDVIDTLNGGLVKIGTLVVGLAVIGFGIYQAISGEFKGKRLALMVFGGVCVIAGPKIMTSLLQAIQ